MARQTGARRHRRATCPYCGNRMRPDKLKAHIVRVHPDGTVSEKDRARVQAWRMEKRRKEAARMAIYVVPVVILLVMVSVYFMFFYKPSSANNSTVGDTAPNLVFTDIQGLHHNISKDHFGKDYLLIEFFSTDCGYCNNVATPLTWLYANYSDRVVFYSFAYESTQEVQNWKTGHGATWSHVSDPGEAAYNAFIPDPNRHSYPHFYLIDRDGVIRHEFGGDQDPRPADEAFDPQNSYNNLEALVKDLLENH